MKNTILILAMFGLAVLAGCKKKEEPITQPPVDITKAVNENTDKAQTMVADAQKGAETAVAAVTEQTKCPILPNNAIDKNVFVEYKGKKVYFCCEACKAQFNKDPEKYIKDLPQFKQ